MPTYAQLEQLKPEQFRRASGVQRATFDRMVDVIAAVRAQQAPGRPSKFCIEDQVLITLEYLRDTYFHIAQSWGAHESTIYRIVRWVETTLLRSGEFRLPGKKQLLAAHQDIEVVVLDASEHPVERPKKQRSCYSGKRRRHVLQSQLAIDAQTGQVICTAYGKGRIHDVKLFKRSKVRCHPAQQCLADKGYQGLHKLHPNSCPPTRSLPKVR